MAHRRHPPGCRRLSPYGSLASRRGQAAYRAVARSQRRILVEIARGYRGLRVADPTPTESGGTTPEFIRISPCCSARPGFGHALASTGTLVLPNQATNTAMSCRHRKVRKLFDWLNNPSGIGPNGLRRPMWYARPLRPSLRRTEQARSSTPRKATTVQPLSRSSKTPLWQQLEHELRRRIQLGDFVDKFPSDRELMEDYGVSRHTARHAVSSLGRDGIVQRLRGIGTALNSGRITQSLGNLYSLFQVVEAAGVEQKSIVLTIGQHLMLRLRSG